MRPTQLRRLDMNLLVVADALLETCSVTETAELVGLSQPAVSRALGRLRDELGDPLLVRDGRGLVPTPFASSLRPRLRASLLELERTLAHDGAFDPAAERGTFSLASADFAAFSFLPVALSRLAEKAPGARLVMSPYREPFEALLEAGEVDVVVGHRPSQKAWVRSVELFASPWVLVARRGHALLRAPTLERVCRAAHVLVSPEGQGPGPVDVALEALGHTRHVALRVPDFAGALAVVAQSRTVTVVPKVLAEGARRVLSLAAAKLPFEVPAARVFVSYHTAREADPRHRFFRDELRGVEREVARVASNEAPRRRPPR